MAFGRPPARRRSISSPAVLEEQVLQITFNSKLRDEFLNGEIFYSLKEVQVLERAGGCTTIPSVHTLRSATDRQRQRVATRSENGVWRVEA